MEIVIAINDAKRKMPWRESRNRLLGTIGKYKITIAGYYKRTSDNRVVQYRIVCPYAIGFDYAFE